MLAILDTLGKRVKRSALVAGVIHATGTVCAIWLLECVTAFRILLMGFSLEQTARLAPKAGMALAYAKISVENTGKRVA